MNMFPLAAERLSDFLHTTEFNAIAYRHSIEFATHPDLSIEVCGDNKFLVMKFDPRTADFDTEMCNGFEEVLTTLRELAAAV